MTLIIYFIFMLHNEAVGPTQKSVNSERVWLGHYNDTNNFYEPPGPLAFSHPLVTALADRVCLLVQCQCRALSFCISQGRVPVTKRNCPLLHGTTFPYSSP